MWFTYVGPFRFDRCPNRQTGDTTVKILALVLSVICVVSGTCGVLGALVDWDFCRFSQYAQMWTLQHKKGGMRVMIGFVGAITLLIGLLGLVWAAS